MTCTHDWTLETAPEGKLFRCSKCAETLSAETLTPLQQAAPDLLAALEGVLDALGALCNPSELSGYGFDDDEIFAVFDAINRAKGVK